jgi:uracil-DNA glycosylase family 4
MFVGEAPGRFGAEIDGIPFHGDHAGRNFERLLLGASLDRRDVFVTNAIICNPQSLTGANARPTADEIRNCASWLERTIHLVDPKIVVSLGGVSLMALDRLAPHGLKLSRDVGMTVRWFDRLLLPLYHPGGRAMARRPYPQQERDWSSIASVLSGLRGGISMRLHV